MSDEIIFKANVRARSAKALLLELEGVVGRVWVPLVVLQRLPGEKGEVKYPIRVALKPWWARKNEDIRVVLARRLAGPPSRARGHFVVRPRAAPAWADLLGRPSAEALRLQRPDVDFTHCMNEAQLSTHEVATLLGLTYKEVSMVDRGLWEFTEPAMWEQAMALMLEEKRRWESFLPKI